MKKIIYATLAVAALFTAASCSKNLEIPQKGVVSYDTFYASDADATAARADMYANYLLNVAGTEGIDNPEQVMLNYSSDDILSAGGHLDDHDGFRVFDEFRYDDANGTMKSAYQRYYYAIYHANLIISNFTNENRSKKEPKFTSTFTKQCVAEARVMRAYLHMMTALIWNCPPIMDRLYDSDELPTNAESQKAVLDWVIKECEAAISSGSLPKRNGKTDKDATAIMTVGFAQFIAGKAAMFNNDPATARKYLKALISSGDYALIDGSEYWTNFHIAGDGNSEKIFEPNIIEDPAFTSSAWGKGTPIQRGRWMVANVFLWRIGNLASVPVVGGSDGWNGGAIQNDFAKKFLDHDGDSPRRKACFITEDEFLYGLDWAGSKVNDGTLAQKKADPDRGIKSAGIFSHGPYFEWKHMVYLTPPKILTGGKEYPADNIAGLGWNSNQKNFNVARYAEALLLYAEACIDGSSDEKADGLKYLNEVQTRSGSGKISTELNFANVMEEKQYEMWFENCRFLDLVRWGNAGKVDLNKVFNESKIHETVTTVYDEFTTEGKPGFKKEHKLFTQPATVKFNKFEDKYKYFPFPRDVKTANPNLKDVLGWK